MLRTNIMHITRRTSQLPVQRNVLARRRRSRHNVLLTEKRSIVCRPTECAIAETLQEAEHKRVAIVRVRIVSLRCPCVWLSADRTQHVVPMLRPCFGCRIDEQTLRPTAVRRSGHRCIDGCDGFSGRGVSQTVLIEFDNGAGGCGDTDVQILGVEVVTVWTERRDLSLFMHSRSIRPQTHFMKSPSVGFRMIAHGCWCGCTNGNGNRNGIRS